MTLKAFFVSKGLYCGKRLTCAHRVTLQAPTNETTIEEPVVAGMYRGLITAVLHERILCTACQRPVIHAAFFTSYSGQYLGPRCNPCFVRQIKLLNASVSKEIDAYLVSVGDKLLEQLEGMAAPERERPKARISLNTRLF